MLWTLVFTKVLNPFIWESIFISGQLLKLLLNIVCQTITQSGPKATVCCAQSRLSNKFDLQFEWAN